MAPPPLSPATATTGHFTRPAPLTNTHTSDSALQRLLKWYIPQHLDSLTPELTRLGDEALSPRITEWCADAERNQPYVKGYNVWGERYPVDRLVTSEGWKRLGAWGQQNGVVALGYEDTYGNGRRMAQYAVNYITSSSSALTSCPASMTDGAALIISAEIARKNLPDTHAFKTTLRHLLSRGPDTWTSGQWMTERAGGSDVQNTETWAVYSPLPASSLRNADGSLGLDEGDYVVNGFKFFSSATDANVALLLAKTAPSGKLSLFLAPLRRTIVDADGSKQEISNGVHIHRLKNKLGTKELPTAELELKGMRAHLVGELDKGVATIAPLLNITRTHTFIGSLAAWRRALDIAKTFSKTRTTVGEPLWLIPMHLRLVAELEGRHRGAMELAFFTVAVMGVVENHNASTTQSVAHLPKPGVEATTLFRVLTATSKAVISKMAVSAIQDCQETMGGVGYMDEPDEPEFNISRILRDTLVNCIWEGTSNVLASECVRFLLKGENFGVLAGWVERVLGLLDTGDIGDTLRGAWKAFKDRFIALRASHALAVGDGRRVMFTLARILSGILLALDAQRDGDAVAREIARRWVSGELGVGDTVWRDIVFQDPKSASEISGETLRWDCRIAWGVELPRVVGGHRSVKL
ncbi:hypothetical protein BDW74DRAFT_185216 [Aspergillus multicolor]|uniref:putative acyl-CoA dehydrogenase n=1 Tax=Aspergillus multicolor TaxID=41759 RepID=UPI003CCCA95B